MAGKIRINNEADFSFLSDTFFSYGGKLQSIGKQLRSMQALQKLDVATR